MADIRLDGTDRAVALALRVRPKRGGERLHLDKVTQWCRRAVRLNVADLIGMNTGSGLGFQNHIGLPADAGSREADLTRAVVVNRGPKNDGVNRIAVRNCFVKPLQQHNSGATTMNGPLRLRVESAAMAVRRRDHAFLVKIALSLGKENGDTASQRHVALEIQQALAGHVYRYQRSGTGGLHGNCRTSQVQFKRGVSRQKIGDVECCDTVGANRGH